MRRRLWTPWLAVLGLELLVIVGIWWFAHPAWSWLVAPAIHVLAGENALHYPNIFRLMPDLYARADLAISMVVGSVVAGASTVLFGAWFSGRPLPAGEGLRRALRRAVALVLGNLPLALLLLGFSFGLDWWLQEREGPGMVRRMAPLLTLGSAILLQAFFLWVNPLLMLGERSLVDAIATLPFAAARGLWAAMTLAIAATIPLFPIQVLTRASDVIVERGRPELVGWIMVIQAGVAVATAFLLTGASALTYQSLVGPALEEDM